MTKADIMLMQARIHAGIAPPGISRRPKKQKHRTEKAKCTKPPHNPLRGFLGKQMRKLQDRRHGRDLSVENLKCGANSQIDWEKAYRRPGSMTK